MSSHRSIMLTVAVVLAIVGAVVSTPLATPQADAATTVPSGSDSATEAAPVALTMDQRRSYLEYYAPIIFKKADEDGGWIGPDARAGRDWMSNSDFDGDRRFSNNKENWENVDQYVAGERPDWDIRPTMYSALIEYTTDDGKFATLLYHGYHAKQKGSIHDWERIEIHLSGITGDPGTGEEVDYVVITEHSKHNVRPGGHEDLNFMPTATGRHVMIWRADQTSGIDVLRPNRPIWGELHFVEDSWSRVKKLASDRSRTAKVDINGHGRKGFHYVFVPEFDREATRFWGALPLNANTADRLASRRGTKSTDVEHVKRVRYELQDLADVAPTFWADGLADRHWNGKKRNILITEPLAGGIDGGPTVPIGVQTFHSRAIDSEDDDEDRKGFINKHWFWGTYLLGCGSNGKIEDTGLVGLDDVASFTGDAYRTGAPNGTRMVANGDPGSAGEYFHQHDYFAHEGTKAKCDDTGSREVGGWLPSGWHLDERGGFDGRWVSLFPDDDGIDGPWVPVGSGGADWR